MGCLCSRLDITLHIITQTKYRTFEIENTYDIQMKELCIFIEEDQDNTTGKLQFIPDM